MAISLFYLFLQYLVSTALVIAEPTAGRPVASDLHHTSSRKLSSPSKHSTRPSLRHSVCPSFCVAQVLTDCALHLSSGHSCR